MIAIIVTHCADCPFAISSDLPWYCDAHRFKANDGPRQLPTAYPLPPEWCPLREADRLVTLKSGR